MFDAIDFCVFFLSTQHVARWIYFVLEDHPIELIFGRIVDGVLAHLFRNRTRVPWGDFDPPSPTFMLIFVVLFGDSKSLDVFF